MNPKKIVDLHTLDERVKKRTLELQQRQLKKRIKRLLRQPSGRYISDTSYCCHRAKDWYAS